MSFDSTEDSNYHNNLKLTTDRKLIRPERHGCVTAWLIIMLLINALLPILYFSTALTLAHKLNTSVLIIYALGIIGLSNMVFTILMLKWKKIGFYAFAILGIITCAININIGISVISSLLGLVGFVILYGVFQIEKNGISTWKYLK
ncbi:MAG: hypothetical protein V4520_07755 [Bacteroidota bacterium]